jgi:hypothetical protein
VARSNNPFGRDAGDGTGGGSTGDIQDKTAWPAPLLREEILFACQLQAQREPALSAALPQLAAHRPLGGFPGSVGASKPRDARDGHESASVSGLITLDHLFDGCSAELYRTLHSLALDALPRSVPTV